MRASTYWTNLKLFKKSRLALGRVNMAQSLILRTEVDAGDDGIANCQGFQQGVVDEYILLLDTNTQFLQLHYHVAVIITSSCHCRAKSLIRDRRWQPLHNASNMSCSWFTAVCMTRRRRSQTRHPGCQHHHRAGLRSVQSLGLHELVWGRCSHWVPRSWSEVGAVAVHCCATHSLVTQRLLAMPRACNKLHPPRPPMA